MATPPEHDLEATAALLEAVQGGAPGAWERFVERYERLVWSVPRRMGFDEADCADVAQATWVLVWRHVKHVRSARGLASWLITTCAREAARHGKRSDRRTEIEELANEHKAEPDPILPPEVASRLEEIQLVRDAIANLDQRCSELLTLTDLEDQPYAKAAKLLGMPIGSVGPTRIRCLAKLMDALDTLGLG